MPVGQLGLGQVVIHENLQLSESGGCLEGCMLLLDGLEQHDHHSGPWPADRSNAAHC